jgi:diguanylate cyclase (GGDEF)-like protein/PAS domain S-box-containing protein
MEERNRRILVIDDNRAIHDDFRKILVANEQASGLDSLESALFETRASSTPSYEVDSAYQGEEGYLKVVEAVKAGRGYALAFVDMRMPPGWDGITTIEKLWETDPRIQVVVCTAYSDCSWQDMLAKFGAADRLLILKKPFDVAEICQLACALTEKWHLAKHAHLKLSQLNSMVEEQTQQLRQEIEERKRSAMMLRASEDRYALAAAGANDGLWDWDLVNRTIFYSPRWQKMLGFDGNLGDSPEVWFERLHSLDREAVTAAMSAHLEGRADHFHTEYRIQRADGNYCWMLCRGLAVRDEQGKAIRIAGSQTDITDRKVAEEQLRHAALHDSLTGLANRTVVLDYLNNCIARVQHGPRHFFAVLFLDLDRFKGINDTLGHMVGDELLIAAAGRLRERLQTLQSTGQVSEQLLSRMGGDEFVVVLAGLKDASEAAKVAELILQGFSEPFRLNGHEAFTSASIGIAMSDAHYECAEEILRDADAAMYQAKSAGRARFRLFNQELHAATTARWRMENELYRAWERQEFCLHYQPIVSLETGEVVELEALIRWQHPERGLVPPGEFIPLAEETGLVVRLGSWALREACHQLRRWKTQLPELPNLIVGVNISGKQFLQNDLVQEIRQVLDETHVAGAKLRLEITETSIMENSREVLEGINKLRELDLRIHLDDFGTGYSSLSYLNRLPIDALKIDRSFVATMADDPTSRSIVQAVVALAHTLNVRVIAEGIETSDQREYLRSIDCDYGQGYYFSKPMTAEQNTEFLVAQQKARRAASA